MNNLIEAESLTKTQNHPEGERMVSRKDGSRAKSTSLMQQMIKYPDVPALHYYARQACKVYHLNLYRCRFTITLAAAVKVMVPDASPFSTASAELDVGMSLATAGLFTFHEKVVWITRVWAPIQRMKSLLMLLFPIIQCRYSSGCSFFPHFKNLPFLLKIFLVNPAIIKGCILFLTLPGKIRKRQQVV